jgi:hypothetical protein
MVINKFSFFSKSHDCFLRFRIKNHNNSFFLKSFKTHGSQHTYLFSLVQIYYFFKKWVIKSEVVVKIMSVLKSTTAIPPLFCTNFVFRTKIRPLVHDMCTCLSPGYSKKWESTIKCDFQAHTLLMSWIQMAKLLQIV